MEYLRSDLVKVFPCTRRGKWQYDAKNWSEKNVSNITNNIVSVPSYVSKYSKKDNKISFVINGYAFIIEDVQALTTKFSEQLHIYANIKITEEEYKELIGQDNFNDDWTVTSYYSDYDNWDSSKQYVIGDICNLPEVTAYSFQAVRNSYGSKPITDSRYEGISFDIQPISQTQGTEIEIDSIRYKCYYLLLLSRDSIDSDWNVPASSYVMFDDNILPDFDINGGELVISGDTLILTEDGLDNLIPYPYHLQNNQVRYEFGDTLFDNGITYAITNSKTINVTGAIASRTAGSEIYIMTESASALEEGTYLFNGCPSGGSDSTYYVTILAEGQEIARDTGDGVTIELGGATKLTIKFVITKDCSINFNTGLYCTLVKL